MFNTTWEPVPEQNVKRIIIVNLSMSVTNIDKTRPKINVDGLFSGAYYQNGDNWTWSIISKVNIKFF